MSETDQYARTGPRPTTPPTRAPSPAAPTVPIAPVASTAPAAPRDQYQHPYAHPRPAQQPTAGSPSPQAYRVRRPSAPSHAVSPTPAAAPSRGATPADAAAPVFVDVSGRRRRLAHRIAAGLFLAAGGYALMVIWSLLGGPVSPDTLMPFSTPQSIGSSARPEQPTVTADAGARAVPGSPRASRASHAASGASAAAGSAHSSAAASASASAAPVPSPSASASTPGHRPTSAPGKPNSSSTAGHGR